MFTYQKLFSGHIIMVIVPHEDDEINTAGALIYKARQEGMRVICVFLTNGDWFYSASIRMQEAIAALKNLGGVPEEDIIFLGYPDGGVAAERSVFMKGRDSVVDVYGQRETYGMDGKSDYAMQAYGHHQTYTYAGLLADLKHVILQYEPDTLVVTDFDWHPDHRMCSLAFETVMGHILARKGNTYHPLVLKGFAYATAYESEKDLFGKHLLSSKINTEALCYSGVETDNPTYEWEKRLRIPVPEACRTMEVGKNPVFQALACHMSQKAIRRTDRIINGDQVFWVRRTDNLIFQGEITVSSGEGKYLCDFQMMGTQDISLRKPRMESYLWIPEASDMKKCCRCTFAMPQHIEKVSLYGNIDTDSWIEDGELYFSNGYHCKTGPLRKGGRETAVSILPQDGIEWVEFRIVQSRGCAAGIAEWEIFSCADTAIRQVHIEMDGNLANQWAVWPGEKPLISAYVYGTGQSIRWYIDGIPSSLKEINEKVGHLRSEIVIRAESAEDDTLYSEVRVFPANLSYRIAHWVSVCKGRWQLWIEEQREKRPHHKLKKSQEISINNVKRIKG